MGISFKVPARGFWSSVYSCYGFGLQARITQGSRENLLAHLSGRELVDGDAYSMYVRTYISSDSSAERASPHRNNL